MALDLLERHDEAISRFRYLAKNAGDSALREKAKYNEAVSRFRKYTLEELEQALRELEEITGSKPSEDDLTNSPVKAFAYAARANAIAHKFIFWQIIFYEQTTDDPLELAERKKKFKPDAQKWLGEIDKMTASLDNVYTNANDSESWDPLSRRQLKWAIQNARGNAYLNCAREFCKPLGTESKEEAEFRSGLLAKALSCFEQCEVLLPAGVETLTNLATTLLTVSKREEARSYCERAITLNPNYEYAYYRLAQSWKDDNRKDETIKVTAARFPKAPRIPGFKELYHRYGRRAEIYLVGACASLAVGTGAIRITRSSFLVRFRCHGRMTATLSIH